MSGGGEALLLEAELPEGPEAPGAARDDVIGLRMRLVEGGIRVELSDACAGSTGPAVRRASVDGGWGLQIVNELSSRWGVSTEGGRRVAWFELSTVDVGRQPVAAS
ncbi:MAG TPA: hypothetical protein VII47_03210 [Actinomycetota bacterium]